MFYSIEYYYVYSAGVGRTGVLFYIIMLTALV